MKYFLVLLYLGISYFAIAQIGLSSKFKVEKKTQTTQLVPGKYKVLGIAVEGTQLANKEELIRLAKIDVGDEITLPHGLEIIDAMRAMWKAELFSDIKIEAEQFTPPTLTNNGTIYLTYKVKEQTRLSRYTFKGINRSDQDDLKEKLGISRGTVITPAKLDMVYRKIEKFYHDKGFMNVQTKITLQPDSLLRNSEKMIISIKKGKRVRVKEVFFVHADSIKHNKLRRKIKNKSQQGFFSFLSNTKFKPDELKNDYGRIEEFYNTRGFRDAKVLKDSVYTIDEKHVGIVFTLFEGRKYYFRNIIWVGNYKYSDSTLNAILKIKKGDVYDKKLLEEKLNYNPNGTDISSLYMDDGYLFFNVEPVEVKVEGDSIDIEMRVFEGTQAEIANVTIEGNTKTNDRVIIRELFTQPGQKFSRSDLIRSQRELANLGVFNPEKINPVPVPDPEKGTVDIVYKVEERPSDQIQLQGGWGGQLGVVGTVALILNNLSTKRFFKADSWQPIPSGDLQRLSINVQANGRPFQSYSLSFTEPWLGGRRPNNLTVTTYYSVQQNFRNQAPFFIKIWGNAVDFGRRLKVPDNFFVYNAAVSYQLFNLKNAGGFFGINTGRINLLSFKQTISRNSIDQPIYPRSGSLIAFSIDVTPPFSILTGKTTVEQRFKWAEYHKWKFDFSWYVKIVDNLVLAPKARFGYLGWYNIKNGIPVVQRFFVGGDGLTGFNLDGREIIGLRGYSNGSIYAQGSDLSIQGGTIYDKFTLELRYPISLQPSATLYVLSFLEAGNNWNRISSFNPFEVYRSGGFGVRVFLPMFGQLGLDWGYRFDDVFASPGMQRSQFHFSIGQTF
ncbi:MAG: outer membrane protein assembly factor BamA [Bacteroidia bacterium]|nr:outer membrane protein assembly factor BamA [Bacteroidia bacterium]